MSKHNGKGVLTLKLDPHNARKHPDRNKAQIAASLKELGAGRSILVDATDTIIAGNGVYEQAQALGYKVKVIEADGKTLIAVKRPDLKGAKARRMALADNRTTETSEWDVDVLADLAANDADALAGLFDERELRDLLGDKMPGGKEETADAEELVDRAGELQKKWQVCKGDLFEVGRHRILCGDSTNAADVARLMGGERAAMVFTDPPYNALKSWKKDEAHGETRLDPSKWFQNDNMEWDEYDAFLRLAFANLDGHSVYICCDYRIYSRLTGIIGDAGWDLKHCIVWKKNVWGLGKRYRFQHEFIIYACRSNAPFYGQRDESDVWDANVDRGDHNTPKPVALPYRAMRNSSQLGECVLDLFCGSGTTLVACEQTGRIGRGMEIEPKYVAVTLERLTALGLEAKRVTDTNGNSKTQATA